MCKRILAGFLLLTLLALPVQAAPATDAQQAIIDACRYDQATDLSSYKLTIEKLTELFTQLNEGGKLPWYTLPTFSYSYNELTEEIVEFTPQSMDSTYDRALYEQKLAEAMDECIHDGMTPEQIALSVHDYLILNCIYDESLEKNTGYDLLVNGSTVCAGYTTLYMDILNRAGVPCVSVSSEPMEHTWNLVQLEGKWYHVDVTWDDPTPDRYGFVNHEYFLVTDEEISKGEKPHSDWVTDIKCTDGRYSDAWWRTVKTPVLFENSQTCYYQRSDELINSIYRRQNDTETLLYTDDSDWVDIGHGAYTYEHQGLALRDGRLWFNTHEAICSVDLSGGDLQTEYRHTDSKTYIYSFSLTEDTANITTGGHADIAGTTSASIPKVSGHTHSYTRTENPPTCQEGGSTVASCDCGLQWETPPLPPLDHDYQELDGRAPSLFRSGYSNLKCSHCGDAQRQELPRLTFFQWLISLFT